MVSQNWKNLIAPIAIVALCWFSFSFGRFAGQIENKVSDKGTFVLTLATLEDLRKGNINQAIEKVESICYASAIQSLADPDVVSLYAPQLKAYRDTYATNKESLTPTERKLDTILKNKFSE